MAMFLRNKHTAVILAEAVVSVQEEVVVPSFG